MSASFREHRGHRRHTPLGAGARAIPPEKSQFVIGVHVDISAADADFEMVSRVAERAGAEMDAAALARHPNGSMRISRGSPEPADPEGEERAECGLAASLATVLFPAILRQSRLETGETSSAISTIVGQVSESLSRADLREIGECLDSAGAALIVAATSATRESVRAAMSNAKSILVKRQHTDCSKQIAQRYGCRNE